MTRTAFKIHIGGPKSPPFSLQKPHVTDPQMAIFVLLAGNGYQREGCQNSRFCRLLCILHFERKGRMLKKQYIRDGKRRIIGSVTTGFQGSLETLVRDEHQRVLGWTSDRFRTTRDEQGRLVSLNTADAGLRLKGTR